MRLVTRSWGDEIILTLIFDNVSTWWESMCKMSEKYKKKEDIYMKKLKLTSEGVDIVSPEAVGGVYSDEDVERGKDDGDEQRHLKWAWRYMFKFGWLRVFF